MRFLIDAPLSPQLAATLTAAGHDAVHVASLGMLRAPDTAIVRRAAEEQRVVITMDLDFPEIMAVEQRNAPGIILIRMSFAMPQRVHERLLALLRTIHPDALAQAVTVLDDYRFRIRKLPLA